MSYYGRCIINPKDFKEKSILRKTIVIKDMGKAVLWGKVLDCNGKVIKGAVIEAIKIDCNYNPYKLVKLGYTTTNEEGIYNICVYKGKNIYYKLCVYPTLKNN